MTKELEDYYNKNWAFVETAWEDHLANIWATDSGEHYLFVRDSEECFWEFPA